MSFIKKRIESFLVALEGLSVLWSEDHSKVHLLATIAVLCAGWYFQIERIEWGLICMSIAMVWVAEGINTAIEHLTDIASPKIHPKAKMTKDVSAGAVLIAAIFAAIIGGIVFTPYLV